MNTQIGDEPLEKYGEIVKVNVGKDSDKQTFFIHPHRLTQRSLFFKNALAANWKEAEDRVIYLPEDDPSIFFRYLDYLYTGKMSVKSTDPDTLNDGKAAVAEQLMTCRIYVFADKVQDMRCRNDAIKFMTAVVKEKRTEKNWFAPGPSCIEFIYNETVPNSPMRRLVVEFYVYNVGYRKSYETTFKRAPKEFLVELSTACMDARLAVTKKGPYANIDKYLEKED
ncbi:hypothetical protein SLS60_006061 [Paraconiothyrium brasiliense]|uniref:BTB domain-containing protein n=1 Tax=Paraconiothyrium brasiliense TaxID=300254 RepID=A0ABR3RDY7_9PLEO